MKHYLAKLVETPNIDDPVHTAPDVHKHFTRYSKGFFNGPAVKITKTAKNITIACSYEMEDETLRIALENTTDDEIKITGAVMGPGDFTILIKDIGLPDAFLPDPSKGKTKKWEATIKTATMVSPEKLADLLEKGISSLYVFANYTTKDKSLTLKMKNKAPRPSNKNPEEASLENKIKFCSLKMENTDKIVKRVLEGFAPDFIDEIPSSWKNIIITNDYEIKDLILPDKNEIKNSRQFRVHTIRKGVVNRVLLVDKKETATNNLEFSA